MKAAAPAASQMNMQQAVQPKSSANGFGRRRHDRDGGSKFNSKLQSGKSSRHRSNAGAAVKIGAYDSPSRDRLVYLSTCLIGHPVEVQLKNGSVYSGTCYTTNVDKEFAIILKMAHMMKDVSRQKAESVSKAPSKTLIITGKDVMQVIAKDLTVTVDGMSNEFQREKQQDLMIDSCISQSRHVEVERELTPWIPDEDVPQRPELENIFCGSCNRGWDQFEANEALFGVKSTFDEELYTTKLEKGPWTRELERKAMRMAREIEGEETKDLHLAEERRMHLHGDFGIDEETRFSSVNRGRVVDDSGFDEIEYITSDLRNDETFGDASATSFEKSADLTYGKRIDGARGLSNLSLDEAQCFQSSTGSDLYFLGSYDHAMNLASELPSTSSTSDSELRLHDSLPTENGGNDGFKEHLEEQVVAHDAQLPKSDDSQLLPSDKKDASDKVGLSPNATSYAPSRVSTKTHEKTSLLSVMSDGAVPALSAKGSAEMQSINSRGGRPSSSTSSNSERVAASSFSGPGISPSSSVGSLSSEKSTLNPHAKEFRLNPNAKSFTPSQIPVRLASPASDASYYPANFSPLPHMHGVPLGIGFGPSYAGNQPVIFNPHIAPLQTPPTYFPPGGPQYGQQMLLGQPRQLLYMPTHQPEMPYRGREFKSNDYIHGG